MRFKRQQAENQIIRKTHLNINKAKEHFCKIDSFYEHILKVKYEEFNIQNCVGKSIQKSKI